MRWKKEEIEYLRKTYPTEKPIAKIVKYLKRSKKAIHHKAVRLELSKPRVAINRPKNKKHRNIYDKNYYEKYKEKLYNQKMKRIRDRKVELSSKLGGKCKKCGYNKCVWALDFHHKERGKEKCMAHVIKDFSKEKALKEAMKCILLCANCHRELHYNQKY